MFSISASPSTSQKSISVFTNTPSVVHTFKTLGKSHSLKMVYSTPWLIFLKIRAFCGSKDLVSGPGSAAVRVLCPTHSEPRRCWWPFSEQTSICDRCHRLLSSWDKLKKTKNVGSTEHLSSRKPVLLHLFIPLKRWMFSPW